jgi:putative transposase
MSASSIQFLVSEPPDHKTSLATAIQALKISVSHRLTERPFWQRRDYDFNVFMHKKRIEKLRYMHRNPVKRRRGENPEDWAWSSYRHYLLNEPRVRPH